MNAPQPAPSPALETVALAEAVISQAKRLSRWHHAAERDRLMSRAARLLDAAMDQHAEARLQSS